MRLKPVHCAVLFVSVVFVGCVQHGCPEGTKDLAGGCVDPNLQRNAKDAGEQARSGIEADGTAGTAPVNEGNDSGLVHDAVDTGPPDAKASADAEVIPTEPERIDAGVTDSGGAVVGTKPTCDDLTCGANAHCTVTDGAPACYCDAGYEGDAQSGCVDIDECTADTSDCSSYATCTNEPGTFSCACKPGYDGDGVTCKANPCEARVNPCDKQTTTCRETDGKAVCDCIPNHDRCDGDPLACNSDLTSDRNNCGECDLVCAGTLACNASKCDQSVTALALGTDHSCAIKDSGEVWCWGHNDYLQLGDATASATQWTPIKAAVASANQIDAGQSRTCSINAQAKLICWGALPLLQGMSGPDGTGFDDIALLSPSILRGMAIGGGANCVLTSSAANCWGYNVNDALSTAIPANAGRTYAMKVNTPLSDAKQIDVGTRVTCVVTGGGHVSCWGGDANPNMRVIEKANGSPLSGVTSVSVSLGVNSTSPVDSACAVTDTGNVWCWGTNAQGELGNPALTDSSSLGAVQVTDSTGAPAENVVEVAVGAYHACARFDDGLVVCWGRTDLIGSGRAGTAIRRTPVEVKGLTDAIELKAGTLHTCARRRTGQVVCWGSNGFGQLGVDPTTTPTSNVPVNVTNLP